MTPDQGSKSGENFNLRPARAGYLEQHMSLITQCSSIVQVAGKGKWQLKADHCRHWPEGQGGPVGKKRLWKMVLDNS